MNDIPVNLIRINYALQQMDETKKILVEEINHLIIENEKLKEKINGKEVKS